METLAVLFILVAWPVGMGLLMAFMGRGLGGSKHGPAHASEPRPDHDDSVAALKREQARMKARVERVDVAGR